MIKAEWKSTVKEASLAGTKDCRFDYRLENDLRLLQRVEQARASVRAGRGVKLEDVK